MTAEKERAGTVAATAAEARRKAGDAVAAAMRWAFDGLGERIARATAEAIEEAIGKAIEEKRRMVAEESGGDARWEDLARMGEAFDWIAQGCEMVIAGIWAEEAINRKAADEIKRKGGRPWECKPGEDSFAVVSMMLEEFGCMAREMARKIKRDAAGAGDGKEGGAA